MLVQEYISKDFLALNMNVFADEALSIAESFEFSHVFIEREGVFQGAISKEFLEENQEKTLGELLMYVERFSIQQESTLLDSIKLFHTFNTNVVPVIDKNEI